MHNRVNRTLIRLGGVVCRDRTSTTADIGAELIRRTFEVTKVAQTTRNLKGTRERTLKEAARSTAAGATETVRRMDLASDAFAIKEECVAALEAENEALRKELASRSTAEKSSETARLGAIERKMEELGPSLIRLIEERLQNIERNGEKEVVLDKTTRRVERGVSNTLATKGGQAVAIEWQTVEGRSKSKKEPAKKQPGKLTPGIGEKSPRKAPGGGSKNARRWGNKLAPPPTHTPRTSAVTIILKDSSIQSYAEVLAAAKDSVSLA